MSYYYYYYYYSVVFQAKENQLLKNVQHEMVDLKCKLDLLKSVDAENKKLNGVVREKERELNEMRDTLRQERDEKMDLLQDKERIARQKDEENKKLQEDNERLRRELSLASEKLKSNQRGAEENLKYRLEQEKDLLLLEQDQDRGAYQRLLKDYHDLEQHAEMLEQKLAAHGAPGHSRSPSNASSGSGQIVSTDDQNAVSPPSSLRYATIIFTRLPHRLPIVLLVAGLRLRFRKIHGFLVDAVLSGGNHRLESTTIGQSAGRSSPI